MGFWRSKIKSFANNKGFSIIEAVVVFSVLVLLSTISLTYSRSNERRLALVKDQAQIVNYIMRAKSLAVQSFSVGENICGYGVHISATGDFIIFKDLATADCATTADGRYTNPSETIVLEKLDDRLEFLTPLEFTDILFTPPDPSISFVPAGAPNIRSITIREKANINSFLKIEVNNYGQVSSG